MTGAGVEYIRRTPRSPPQQKFFMETPERPTNNEAPPARIPTWRTLPFVDMDMETPNTWMNVIDDDLDSGYLTAPPDE